MVRSPKLPDTMESKVGTIWQFRADKLITTIHAVYLPVVCTGCTLYSSKAYTEYTLETDTVTT